MPPASPFDPCREWLGISALEIDDPRTLLGVAAGESDPIRILQAAEARIARLAAVPPGSYEVARQALLKRVHEARDRLLASATPSANATPRAPAGLSMPPPPPSAASSFSGGAAPAPTRPSPPPPPPRGGADSFIEDPDPSGPIVLTGSSVRPYRKQTDNTPLYLLVGALAIAVAALAYYAFQHQPATHPKPDRVHGADRSVAAREESVPGEKQPAKASSKDPARHEKSQTRTVRDDSEPEIPLPPPPPTPPSPLSVPEPKPEPRPEPEPAPPPKPDDSPDVGAEIDRAAKACLKALSRREFDAAEGAMTPLERLGKNQREADRVAGFVQLVKYAKGFFDYRDQAIDAMKSGDEYQVGAKLIAIVEVDEQKVVAKVAGAPVTWPRDEIPSKVVMAVLTSWFDSNPANNLYLGAYELTRPEPDLEAAEALFSKGMVGGADASLLLPLLSDPVVVEMADGQ